MSWPVLLLVSLAWFYVTVRAGIEQDVITALIYGGIFTSNVGFTLQAYLK